MKRGGRALVGMIIVVGILAAGSQALDREEIRD